MKKKLIQFKNIVKSYEDGKVVLKGIDLDIYENEFVTLLGPSGCVFWAAFCRQIRARCCLTGRKFPSCPPIKEKSTRYSRNMPFSPT